MYCLVYECSCDEIRSFRIQAILKYNQVVCAEERCCLLFSIISFWYFSKMQMFSDDVINSTEFWSTLMKKDISVNLNQECLILCSKILLDVLYNMSIPVSLPWQHAGFHNTSLTGFADHLRRSILTFPNAWLSKHINILGQVCGPARCFSSWKSSKLLKSGWEDWKEWVAMGTKFLIPLGLLPVEVFAY